MYNVDSALKLLAKRRPDAELTLVRNSHLGTKITLKDVRYNVEAEQAVQGDLLAAMLSALDLLSLRAMFAYCTSTEIV